MDSINRQQPEENRKDVQGLEAGKKIKELVEAAKNSCFFCTGISEGKPVSTRPMSAQKIDDDGVLWFLSANDSNKNKHIAADPAVQLMFQGSPHSDFLTLYGKATISTDKQKIKELWEPILKVWFTEGENDPRISVIKFVPETDYEGADLPVTPSEMGLYYGKVRQLRDPYVYEEDGKWYLLYTAAGENAIAIGEIQRSVIK